MRRLFVCLLAGVTALAGCEFLTRVDRSKITDGGAGTGGSGGGGTGGSIACVQVTDCPGTDTECRSRACSGGVCGTQGTAEGHPISAQIAGDCQQIVCDGAGSQKQIDDPADVLDDGNPCTVDACAAGVPRNHPAPSGTACSAGGGKVCDGAGRCVACLKSAACPASDTCAGGRCLAPTCSDEKQDDGETAVDCGGPCLPCADGAACQAPADCRSLSCSAAHLCAPATCSDGIQNGGETGVDCGGSCPVACGPGQGCAVAADCRGGACSGSVCLATCSDGAKDGTETGTDCGGLACAPCSPGGGCAQDADCFQAVCHGGTCVLPACADGKKDGAETDVDCGGPACPACAPGAACASASDCTSRVCASETCGAPSCADHVKNGAETGVDCGGPTCSPCPDGEPCAGASDCQSALCADGLCYPPTCTDGQRDGTETDVDCGGGACPGCPGGGACVATTDCASKLCDAGHCTTSTCSDHTQNGAETDVDCGGGACPGCALGLACLADADCAGDLCVAGACAVPTCTDKRADGTETDVDCGGGTCPPCPDTLKCLSDTDCLSAGCFAGTCGDKIVVSQVRSNGPDGDKFGDDFIEIYNPGQSPVTLDASWNVWHRSAQGSCQGEELRFTGAGQTIPPHAYYLMVGLSYVGPKGDIGFTNVNPNDSIADAASIRVQHGAVVVDALCYAYDATTLGRLTGSGGCTPAYVCHGTPASNLPHDGTTGATSIVDAALERKPGGALGDQQDTGDSLADFLDIMPSHPRNSASPRPLEGPSRRARYANAATLRATHASNVTAFRPRISSTVVVTAPA